MQLTASFFALMPSCERCAISPALALSGMTSALASGCWSKATTSCSTQHREVDGLVELVSVVDGRRDLGEWL